MLKLWLHAKLLNQIYLHCACNHVTNKNEIATKKLSKNISIENPSVTQYHQIHMRFDIWTILACCVCLLLLGWTIYQVKIVASMCNAYFVTKKIDLKSLVKMKTTKMTKMTKMMTTSHWNHDHRIEFWMGKNCPR